MDIKERNELHIAYLQTEFSIDFPDQRIWISPLSENPEFQSHLLKRGVKNWALITPFNPGSRFLSDGENQSRLKKFEEEELLKGMKLSRNSDYLPSISKPREPGITGEAGFWIANIFPWEAIRMGRRWEQNAILIGRSDGRAELLWCDHESQVYLSKGD